MSIEANQIYKCSDLIQISREYSYQVTLQKIKKEVIATIFKMYQNVTIALNKNLQMAITKSIIISDEVIVDPDFSS